MTITNYRDFYLFAKNRSRWAHLDSAGAARLSAAIIHPVDIQEFSSSVIEDWKKSLPLDKCNLLFVFGVNLGEAYTALEPWLSEDDKRVLVFLEPDPSLLTAFLSTTKATELLANQQVLLYYIPLFEDQHKLLGFLSSVYPFYKAEAALLPTAISRNIFQWQTFLTSIELFWQANRAAAQEIQHSAGGFLKQFYSNLLILRHSYDSGDLKGRFQSIPAIICGAGPSLSKNRHLLSSLKDRALIISGGTAINALNGGNIHPHIGVGIDPNPSFYHRILTSTSWHIPFFYYYRMYNPALAQIHGDKLLCNLKGSITLPEWFHDELNAHISNTLDSQLHNVINLCTLIAIDLGCNPLIFIGLDLAYSHDSAYAEGLSSAAIHHIATDFRTKHDSEEVIVRHDIFGQPVKTLWKWVVESSWYSQLAAHYPQLTMINATEGGIGFPNIPNASLAEVKERYLSDKMWDLTGWLHSAIQRCHTVVQAPVQAIQDAMNKLLESVKACQEILKQEMNSLTDSALPLDEKWQSNTFPSKKVLTGQPAYDHLLNAFDFYHTRQLEHCFSRLDLDRDKHDPTAYDETKRKIHMSRYRHFYSTLAQQRYLIGETLNAITKPSPISTLARFEKRAATTSYSCYNGLVKIIDATLNLEIYDSSPRMLEEKTICDEQGHPLVISSYTTGGILHGPSTGYNSEGIPLAITWFFEGLKEGLALFFWNSGSLYSKEPYLHGKRHGISYYYYADGSLRSLISHRHDNLDGTVLLYYPNGQLQRRAHYVNGLREGSEEIWQADGILILQAYYHNDHPIGIACQWHDNGVLARRKVFNNTSELISDEAWTFEGSPSPLHATHDDSFLADVREQIELLYSALKDVENSLSEISPFFTPNTASCREYETECAQLQQNLVRVDNLRRLLDPSQQSHTSDTAEPLWKTPTFMLQISSEKNALTTALQDHLAHLNTWVNALRSPTS